MIRKRHGGHTPNFNTHPNEFTLATMGREGDDPAPANVRWGKRVILQWAGVTDGPANLTKARATIVSTPMFPNNTPIAFALRFGYAPNITGGQDYNTHPFTPELSTANIAKVTVTLERSIDARATAVSDSIILESDEIMPEAQTIARQLTITVALTPIDPSIDGGLVVEVVATPVSSINGADISGRTGFAETSETNMVPFVLPAGATVASSVLGKSPRRTQLLIVNTHPTNHVAIGFGNNPGNRPFVNAPDQAAPRNYPFWYTVGGILVPYANLVLPGGSYASYETDIGGWTGEIWAMASNTTTDTIILVSEGLEVEA